MPLQIGRTYCASCAASITPAERTRRWRAAKRAELQEYRLFRRDEPLPVWVYRAWLNQLAALARDSREAAAARSMPAPELGEKSASAAGLRRRSRRQ
ncbi:MAG: hypothetical protein ACM3II_13270 [Rhodospirillaceae bacterium]